jgi:hypothetical protein
MTRTDVMVSSGTHTEGAGPIAGETSTRFGATRRRVMRRGLVAIPVALAFMAPAVAQAASAPGTSGYGQTTPAPKTTPKPKQEVAPSKEPAEPTTTTPSSSNVPTATPATPAPSTLPFTGLDLRWVVGAGVLLLAGGLSIRLGQRRQRHGVGR